MEIQIIDLTELDKILSPNRKRYLCNIVDASSKYGWSYLVNDKKAETIISCLQKMQNTLEGKTKIIKSDNGGEFTAGII